jgi:hypothetical protein
MKTNQVKEIQVVLVLLLLHMLATKEDQVVLSFKLMDIQFTPLHPLQTIRLKE